MQYCLKNHGARRDDIHLENLTSAHRCVLQLHEQLKKYGKGVRPSLLTLKEFEKEMNRSRGLDNYVELVDNGDYAIHIVKFWQPGDEVAI